ncbi:hypothetical protein Stalingrad_10 [Pseudomonas phage Stalingrad]|uniref:Uncharacterized protein n=1 Tax=Pseudomonas phage Stalingrad TaxID=2762287 RepID=A0A7G8LJ75_9CAUD|nr:hypothetical protein Stalingrad_10 [Pseudomonas phage Stalingrad]
MSKLIDIKFTVENPPHLRHVDQNVAVKHKGGLELIEFKTGWGPCGRWVAKLEHKIDTATLRIKQTSFPVDMTEHAAEYSRLVKEVMRLDALVRSPSLCKRTADAIRDYRKADDALKAHTAIAKDCMKVEHFVYQLEDIRGRIKATEDTSG